MLSFDCFKKHDNVPRRYTQHHLFPKPRNPIYSPPSDLMSMDPILTPPGDESQSLCWKCFRKLHISSGDNDDGEMTPFQHPPLHFNHQHNHHQHPLSQHASAGSRILTFANWVIAEADKTKESTFTVGAKNKQ